MHLEPVGLSANGRGTGVAVGLASCAGAVGECAVLEKARTSDGRAPSLSRRRRLMRERWTNVPRTRGRESSERRDKHDSAETDFATYTTSRIDFAQNDTTPKTAGETPAPPLRLRRT